MSNVAIRRALETRLNTLPEKPVIAWENSNFTPTTGVPFLSTFLLFAQPDDAGGRDAPFLQRGYLQVGLHYPTNTGPGAAQVMAEAVRRHFRRGLTVEADGVRTIIERTPEITGGAVEDGRYTIRVRARFFAHIEPS